MKKCKILCLVLALVMVLATLVACGGEKDTTPDTTNDDVADTAIVVNIIVRASKDGEDVYASDAVTGYTYVGAVKSPLAILEEFMDFEHDVTIEFDEDNKLIKVGEIAAEMGQLWLWDLAEAPLDASSAKPMSVGLDEYTTIKDGDTIVIYLS